MKKEFFLVVVFFLFSFVSNGQNKWSLRTNAGIASGTNAVDGYYFSFDIGIPLLKSLEIAPTFTNASMLQNRTIYYNWDFTYGISTKNKAIQSHEQAENLSSISLLLNFKPFELMTSEKFTKHELIIGTGVSYNSYTIIKESYQSNGKDYDLIQISVRADRKIEPFYCKLSYNYLFKENLFLGLVGGINGFDSEAELLVGLQFGIKFN